MRSVIAVCLCWMAGYVTVATFSPFSFTIKYACSGNAASFDNGATILYIPARICSNCAFPFTIVASATCVVPSINLIVLPSGKICPC